MKAIQRQLDELEASKVKLQTELEQARGRLKFKCGCGAMHAIKDCVALYILAYEPPSGCNDGAYWYVSETNIVCPKTELRNRLLYNSEYEIPYNLRNWFEYSAELQFDRYFMHLFKEVQRVERDKAQKAWVNNYYIDENRKKFGIRIKGIDK